MSEPPLSDEAIAWAFRLLIGREPFPGEVEQHRHHPDLDSLRRTFSQTWEFFDFYDRAVDGRAFYGMPLFLLRPPADPSIPWRFQPPSLDEPVSQLCTTAQFDDPAFAEIMEAMGTTATRTRRSWEQAFIVSTLATHGMIAPQMSGLGFGVGRERIPSLLASRGVQVLGSDTTGTEATLPLPPGAQLMALFHPEVLHMQDFERLVQFRALDMRAIPADLDSSFDFCWSASAADRLGSVALGMEFIEASLRTLRPGGVAVHTMQLNLRSDSVTLEGPELSVPRRRDIEALAQQLTVQGHAVSPLNFHPGLDPQDEELAVRPGEPPRPKQRQGAVVLGSFGLAIRKAA